MRTSVVVATAGRPAELDRCLAALAADGPDEVLVVDNAPSAATRAAAGRHGARWLPEPRPGKSHALNTGVAAATGEAVLFTDDDVVVRPGWTAALRTALQDPRAGLVAGRVLPCWQQPPPPDLGPHVVHLTLVDHGPARRVLGPEEPVFGAALAARAEVLRALAPPFDPLLGPRPGLKLGHEELRLADRVRASGLDVVHEPDAVAEHHVDPARATRAGLRRTVLATGVGEARRARLGGAPLPPLPRRLAELAVVAVRAACTDDLGARAQLGRRLERVTGRWPHATDALARWVA